MLHIVLLLLSLLAPFSMPQEPTSSTAAIGGGLDPNGTDKGGGLDPNGLNSGGGWDPNGLDIGGGWDPNG